MANYSLFYGGFDGQNRFSKKKISPKSAGFESKGPNGNPVLRSGRQILFDIDINGKLGEICATQSKLEPNTKLICFLPNLHVFGKQLYGGGGCFMFKGA